MAKRIERVNQLLKEEIDKIILKELEFPKDIFVAITNVESTPNLQQAKVFVSAIPDNRIKDVLKILNGRVFEIQQIINKRLNMRPVPRINFVEDKEAVEAGRIEELLEQIKKEER